MNTSYLSIKHLRKSFRRFVALSDVSIDIGQGEFICLLGPSGCGKTTLLRILAGLEQPDSGTVMLDGRDITRLPSAERKIGMMFQSYALFPNMTAAQNIAFGLGGRKLSRSEIRDKVDEALDLIDLQHVRDRYPGQMSGGQQQRIALARAVAMSPRILLLDEPLSALDAKVRQRLRYEIRELQERLGITTVMVTHDQEEALAMADRIVVMNHAQVIQAGTPEDVYEKPATPFVADFIGVMNFLPEASEAAKSSWTAIRPEEIRVVKEGAIDALVAEIRGVEYRGPYYRLLLAPEDEPQGRAGVGTGVGGKLVTVDLPAEEYKRRALAKHMRISLQLPAGRRLTYLTRPGGEEDE